MGRQEFGRSTIDRRPSWRSGRGKRIYYDHVYVEFEGWVGVDIERSMDPQSKGENEELDRWLIDGGDVGAGPLVNDLTRSRV